MPSRRKFIKAAGVAGVATAAGVGLGTLNAGAVPESGMQIDATGPVTVEDERGQVERVYIQPDIEVEWENFTEAPGKIFTHIEARVDDGEWLPIFRVTLWSTPPTNESGNGEGTTGPGPTGSYRSDFGVWSPPILIADNEGVPDYEAELANEEDVNSYLNATDTFGLDGDQFRDYHEDFGYYGPAAHADAFDAEKNETTRTSVDIRYTLAFQSVNSSMLSGYVEFGDVGAWSSESEIEEALEEANPRDSVTEALEAYEDEEDEFSAVEGSLDFWSDVHVEEVTTSDESVNGNSVLVMNGEDDYPDITDAEDVSTPSDNNVEVLRRVADRTPSVITGETSFVVDVTDLEDDSGVTGESNPGAE